jgi:NAD(P)-dependent dehydrogenase (short-subunit alcohol dehydrogenase family)
MRLEGKVAIVTGAGRGIGRGEAMALAREGVAVVVNDFGGNPDGTGGDAGPAQQVADEIVAAGGKAAAHVGDVARFQTGEELVQLALDQFGGVDILVNNAGILRDRMIHNMSEAEWDAVLDIHLKGTFNCTRAAAQVFRSQRSGVIVNTSSESGFGNLGQPNYSAAKEGIIGFTRTIARDPGRYGCRANAIRPRAATRLTLSDEMREAAEKAAQGGDRRAGRCAAARALGPRAGGAPSRLALHGRGTQRERAGLHRGCGRDQPRVASGGRAQAVHGGCLDPRSVGRRDAGNAGAGPAQSLGAHRSTEELTPVQSAPPGATRGGTT